LPMRVVTLSTLNLPVVAVIGPALFVPAVFVPAPVVPVEPSRRSATPPGR
jgi:hypothetical protein